MPKGLPSWLLSRYSRLLVAFGFLPFGLPQAKELLAGGPSASLILYRLKKLGWVEALGRHTYRVVHPLALLTELTGNPWRERIRQRDRLPLLELCVARCLEAFGGSLVSIVVFGSLSAGEAKPESDMDLLVVARDLPQGYPERVRIANEIASSRSIQDWRRYLWHEGGVHPLIDMMLLTPEEAETTHPFYLDMVDRSITIYDRDGFMERRLSRLRRRLSEAGAKRVQTPDGSSYWVLSKAGGRLVI
jgi:hypothetical protein